ncbi:hypothetical protein [Neotabrizicola sp. sgz301269]|uniref:hypothetical protein n=1 Tax=Neotabrizicola sp. sgz301269 TaxID=3276282 RepID=UPI00376F78A1
MKILALAISIALLGACSSPYFVGDAPPVPVTTQTPDHFELPARFAVARVVYGQTRAAGAEEQVLWKNLAEQSASLGSFSPLITGDLEGWRISEGKLIEAARRQNYNYLLVVWMEPATGSADVILLDVGSGGKMATAQAVAPSGGQHGFWGGEIRNPARLERATLKIAKATVPEVEELLRGIVERQR